MLCKQPITVLVLIINLFTNRVTTNENASKKCTNDDYGNYLKIDTSFLRHLYKTSLEDVARSDDILACLKIDNLNRLLNNKTLMNTETMGKFLKSLLESFKNTFKDIYNDEAQPLLRIEVNKVIRKLGQAILALETQCGQTDSVLIPNKVVETYPMKSWPCKSKQSKGGDKYYIVNTLFIVIIKMREKFNGQIVIH